jgi:mono/diheme cytochrome c family protein
MRKVSSLVVAFVAILAGPTRPADEPKTVLPENVKIIFSRSCGVSGCHQGRFPAGNLNFEPDKLLSAAINTPSQEVPSKKIIDTSTPEKSYLLAKIKGEPGIVGARMPAYRDPLSAEEIKAIEAWIMSLKP